MKINPPKPLQTEPATEAEILEVDSQPTPNLPMVVQQPTVNPCHGIALVPITPEKQAKLEEPIDPEQLDILPTGVVYMSQVWYRRKLNSTFGCGRWGLLPQGEYIYKEFKTQGGKPAGTLMHEYALIVEGCFVGHCIGESDYHPSNDRSSYATAAESLKSNALSRLCKDLGIASECWDTRFTEKWISENAISVWRKEVRKPEWRRRDAKPFWNETGIADDPQAGKAAPQPNAAPQSRPQPANGSGADPASPSAATGQETASRAAPKGDGWHAGRVIAVTVAKTGGTGGGWWRKLDVVIDSQGPSYSCMIGEKSASLQTDLESARDGMDTIEYLLETKENKNKTYTNLVDMRWPCGTNQGEIAGVSRVQGDDPERSLSF